jgi:hypothetical protein
LAGTREASVQAVVQSLAVVGETGRLVDEEVDAWDLEW